MTDRLYKYFGMLVVISLLAGCFGGPASTVTEQQRKLTDLNDRALVSSDKGYAEEADRLLNEAFRYAASLDDNDGMVITLLNQARLARRQQELNKASIFVEQALKRSTGSIVYADAAFEKGLQALATNQLDEADRWAEIALKAEKGDLAGRRLNLKARVALLQGRLDQALSAVEQALSGNRSDHLTEERANSIRLIGQIRSRQRLYHEAKQQLEQALLLDKQLGLPAKIATDLEALAENAGLQGDLQGQLDYAARAKQVRDTLMIRK